MSLRKRKSFIQRWESYLSRFHFARKEKDSFLWRHALQFLNGAQFLGVVNDNVFKFLIVFLFIALKGVDKSSEILFWVGTIYVLPFLLFSPAAGVLADRFSKQRMIIFLKFTEVIIMGLGIVAFMFKSDWASYSLLFLLSLQSAIFGPPKYSIIAELVPTPAKIPKANGLITSFTYLGIIVGTFLASFLTQVTDRNFPLAAGVCTLIAIGGFISSLFIPYTEPKRSEKKINPLFSHEIYRNLKYAKTIPYLFVAILGGSSFLFIGAYFQLNVIPYAIQSMGLSEVGGGYLFLLTAIGIAFGAFLAGRISHKRIEVGLACVSGMLLSVTLFVISFLSHQPVLTCIALVVLGLFGGFYIVPFDAYIQTYSPDQKRGQIVAASNFLSFCGVLVAPMLLYLFGGIMNLSAARGFTITSVLIFLMVLAVTSRFAGYFFNFICRFFVRPLYNVEIKQPPKGEGRPFVLVMEQIERLPLCLLSASDPRLHFYIPRERKRYRDSFMRMFSSVDFLYVEDMKENLLRSFVQKLHDELDKEETPCLLFPDPSFLKERSSGKLLRELRKIQTFDLKFVTIQETPRKNQRDRVHFKRPKIVVEFSDRQ
ncbi:MFS transporter [Simkania sp.]|uniref:MFS transporter n=1 Tax=Simkania sp. TaxID=34094 RepID=UPI003B526C68